VHAELLAVADDVDAGLSGSASQSGFGRLPTVVVGNIARHRSNAPPATA